MIGLTDTEAKVCAVLLRYAADHYGNHGCNDFRLGTVIPDMHERRKLMRDYHVWNGDPEVFDDKEDCDITCQPRSAALLVLAGRLLRR